MSTTEKPRRPRLVEDVNLRDAINHWCAVRSFEAAAYALGIAPATLRRFLDTARIDKSRYLELVGRFAEVGRS